MNTELDRKQSAAEDKAAPTASHPEPERDRRGVPLPPRQRVGGIITPQ